MHRNFFALHSPPFQFFYSTTRNGIIALVWLNIWLNIFLLPMFSQEPDSTIDSSKSSPSAQDIEKWKTSIQEERKRLDKLEKEIKSFEQNNNSQGDSQDRNYVSPMKSQGLSPDFMRSMFLDPKHAKEVRENQTMWLNDIIRAGFLVRPRYEARQNLDFNSQTDDYANRILQATQIWFLVDPNPYLSLKVTVQDARVWGGSSPAQAGDRRYFFANSGTVIDPNSRSTTSVPNETSIREAFFILKHPDIRLKATLGRQVFAFGDQRMIGGANWNTNGLSYDGVKLDWNSKYLDSSLFGAKMTASTNGPNGVITANGRRNGSIDDSYLVGTYNTFAFTDFLVDIYGFGILKKWIPRSPSYLGEVVPNEDVLSRNRSRQNDELITVGTRWTNRTAKNFLPVGKSWDWTIESAFQMGNTGQRLYASWDIFRDGQTGYSNYTEKNKYTGQLHVVQTGYTFFQKLRFGGQYSYASGDPNRRDGSVSTFQTLPNPRFGIFPYFDSVAGIGENISLRNLQSYNLNITYESQEWGSFTISGFIHRKAVKADAWYAISSDPNTGGRGSCSFQNSMNRSSSSFNEFASPNYSGSTENCNGNSYSIQNGLGSGIFNEIDFSWIYHWKDGISIWSGIGYMIAGDSIRKDRLDILNPNFDKHYNLDSRAIISYLQVQAAL
ncbi:alginate export family protein [Leptospira sp. GIMC2001]|uniref:alginate export family protein n=1 Tax=Leptospira sp. GIMC2001 TaxID=1513297 RepID=UPI002349028F|nr:alginate export family protein [Leptospira sp. GIMC2001]WCL50110.1 alginate export family protein [Leptospira sp. GIMC2001]